MTYTRLGIPVYLLYETFLWLKWMYQKGKIKGDLLLRKRHTTFLNNYKKTVQIEKKINKKMPLHQHQNQRNRYFIPRKSLRKVEIQYRLKWHYPICLVNKGTVLVFRFPCINNHNRFGEFFSVPISDQWQNRRETPDFNRYDVTAVSS